MLTVFTILELIPESDEEFENQFKQMDSDLDGIVSYKDFRRWIKMGDPTGRGSSQVLRLVSSA